MIWKIARKEILLNLMTFKFAARTIVRAVQTGIFCSGFCVIPAIRRAVRKKAICHKTIENLDN